MDPAVQKPLVAFLFSKTRRAVLSLLFNHTERAFYLREIVRITRIGIGPVQRELRQLTEAGVVRKTAVEHRVYFQANKESPVFSELGRLVINDSTAPDLPVPPRDLRRRFVVPKKILDEFCRRHHIRKLSLFGSVLRDDFRADSDIDVLVEFEPGRTPGLFAIADMEIELSELTGRKVDLRTPGDLSRYFRADVVREAKLQYEATR
jgi:predicted nucleotidyltransferase